MMGISDEFVFVLLNVHVFDLQIPSRGLHANALVGANPFWEIAKQIT
jgi:hypothetical protein